LFFLHFGISCLVVASTPLLPTYFELCHLLSFSFLYCLFNSCWFLCCCSWSFIACLLWIQSFAIIPIPLLHAHFELNLLLLLPFLRNLHVLQAQSFVVAPLPFHACFKLNPHTLSFAKFFRYLLSTLHLCYLPTSSLVPCWYFPPPLYIGLGAQSTTYLQILNFFTWSIAIFFIFFMHTFMCLCCFYARIVSLNVCLYIFCHCLFVMCLLLFCLFDCILVSHFFGNFFTNINACV
jgi:hypothetical protein